MARRRLQLRLSTLVLLAALLLSGCTISSGLQQSGGQAPGGGGNLSVRFVTSDTLGGASEGLIPVAEGSTELEVIGTVSLQRGTLRLEILKPDGSVALTVDGRTDGEQVATARVSSDDQGRLRYRVSASEAKHGHYQIIYRPVQ